MSKRKLSVCLATYNEEKNINRCLKSVVDLADEIVVVDGSSTDKTREIAKKFGAKIIVTTNKPMFHKNKQMAIDKASGDWILLLDADEEVDEVLKKEISSKVQQAQQVNGFWVPRKNIIFGKWIKHTGWWPDYQLKLFKKDRAYLPCQSIHEQPVLKGKSEKLKNPLIHHHYQTISQFLKRLDLYTDNDVRIYLKEKKDLSWQDALLLPIDEFIKRFVAWHGYKDGLHGLVLSLLQAFSRLVVFAKAWEAKKFIEKEIKQDEVKKNLSNGLRNYIWWEMEAKVNPPAGGQKSKVKKAYYKLIRKIKIG